MNIANRIREIAKKFPDKKSVVLGKDKSFYTFSEFEDRSNQIANQLSEYGIRPGMRTLLFVKPCLDFPVITFALFKIGAVPVLIDPGMGLPNLLNSIKQVKPEAMVSIGMVHWLRRMKGNFFRNIRINVSLNRVGGSTRYLYQNLDSQSKSFGPLNVENSDYAAILFTSGGTGIPKGVLYTHGILNAQTDALRSMFHLNEHETDLPGFPLFALFTLAMGMTSVIPEMDPTKPAECDPKKIVKNIIAHKITFVAGSPAIWERVGKYCVANSIKLPSVKYVVMFGAPVRAEIHQLFKKILDNGDTFTPYGATECLPVSLISGTEVLKYHMPLMLRGYGTCIGKAVPETTIKIIETTDIPEGRLQSLPPGEIGEIVVTGKQVTPSYFEMDEETRKAKINVDGKLWHRMGDLGWIDQDNNLWFLGRKSHRVETQDGSFFPIQMEAIFNQHPRIRRSALVKIVKDNQSYPGIVIERHDKKTRMDDAFLKELQVLKETEEFTHGVQFFFLHPGLPVDVRHNIKIDRIKLTQWAQEQISQS